MIRKVARHTFRISLWLVVLSLVCAALALGGLMWAVSNQSASARLLAMVPGLKLIEPSGTLWGDFQSRRLEWRGANGQVITLIEPRWRGLTLLRSPAFPWKLQWRIDTLEARRLDVFWPPSKTASTGPLQAPSSLTLPFGLKVVKLSVDRVESNLLGSEVVLDVKASVALQQPVLGAVGDEHRVRIDSLRFQGWQLSGEGQIATAGSMALAAKLAAVSSTGRVDVSASGPLKRPSVEAQAQMQSLAPELPRGGMAAEKAKVTVTKSVAVPATASSVAAAMQSVSAQAELLPFEAWPVLKAQVSARQFDLQRLVHGLPATALSGQIVVQPRDALPGAPGLNAAPQVAAKAPTERAAVDLLAHVDLSNDRPGLWDAGQVPVKQVLLDITLPAQASMGQLAQVGQAGMVQGQLTLAGQSGRSPGKVAIDGQWSLSQRASTKVTATVTGLDLRALDSRAPALLLKGQVQVQGQADQNWQISGALDGSDGGGRALAVPVQARWLAHWAPQTLKVDQLVLQAGQAKAQGSGLWNGGTPGDARQLVNAKATLTQFDPAVWVPWPVPAGDALQRTRLDGELTVSLSASREGVWQGQGKGALVGSTLLGVPTEAQWQIEAQPVAAGIKRPAVARPVSSAASQPPGLSASLGATTVVGKLTMKAAGNQLQADVRWPLVSLSGEDLWARLVGAQVEAKLDAPSLAGWQPWARVLGMGGLTGQAKLEGRFVSAAAGQWQSSGQLSADGIQWEQAPQGKAVLQGAGLRWVLSSDGIKAGAQPWSVSGDVAKAQWGQWVLQQGQVSLEGPWRDQKLLLQGRVDLPQRNLPGGGVIKESVRAQVMAQGGWKDMPGSGGDMAWQGRVQAIKVVPLTVAPVAPWLEVQPFDMRWSRDEQGARWQASPTRAQVFGAALDFKQWQWQPGPQGNGQFDLDVQLQPIKVADLLARFQPRAGWGGDLTINGRVKAVHTIGQAWVVDAQLARQDGDLSLTEMAIDGANVQRLGVRQIRIDLKARDGVWTLSELLDGRVLGQLQGQQVVQVKDPADLPGPQDLLSGQLSARVDNLRPLGVWAPPGWRLGGELSAKAGLSGRLGAPQYTGQVVGQKLSLGNALLGVQLSEGDLLLTLQGDQAKLDHFRARGGGEPGGQVSLSGEALLGAEPTATLNLKADHFGLFQRVDRQAVVSGDVRVDLGAELIKADGRIVVDQGLIDLSHADAPTVGDDVVVVNRPDADPDEEANPGNDRKRKLAITLAVDLGKQLRLRGRGLDTRLGGALRLSTPSGRLSLQGTVATSDGTYAAYGQKLVIERGTISFTGPVENPRLDIQAMRAQSPTAASSDVKVGVLITGTAQDPRVRLYSEPAMSETEKLSWLVLGRGPTGLGGADIGLLQTAASALWAGDGPSSKDSLISAIGLDELSVRQTDGAVRDTIVSLGKQISSRWYLGYERSLNATTGSWQAIYRLAQRFTLRAQTGDDNALDVIWSWRWD